MIPCDYQHRRSPDGQEIRRHGRVIAILRPGCTRWAVRRRDRLGLWRPATAEEQDRLDTLAGVPAGAAG